MMAIHQIHAVCENSAAWFAHTFPSRADIDLGRSGTLHTVTLPDPAPYDGVFRLYGSLDEMNFSRLPFTSQTADGVAVLTVETAVPLRYLRVQVVDHDHTNPPEKWLKAIDVTYAPTADDLSLPTPDPVAALPAWQHTAYAEKVTAAEVTQYLSDLVGRVLGKKYVQSFSFCLTEGETDAYYVDNGEDGASICVSGTSGVAMAAGLAAYLRTYCHVHVAEQEKQVVMPDVLPMLDAPLACSALDKVRYANNYCTLSYTMPYWDEAEWQQELDWLALRGVNVVLDFTGIEAVWVLFMRRLGCTEQEIEDFIVGPCYTAWQQMQNIQGLGGPVHRQFIADRVQLARANQRKMRILGMQPVRQAYGGMLPAGFEKHFPELPLYPQGSWNGTLRPSMLDPTSDHFTRIAALFYQCQDEILGSASHYYAIDPYHEGGNRPEGLTDATVSRIVLGALLKYDAQAIWMVQAWHTNPTGSFLSGVPGDQRHHLMILDLSATDNPRFQECEFQDTPWIYCMLDMYGGRRSVHGEADVLAENIPAARQTSRHMVGIGATAEATWHNPVVFDLLYEMAWHDQPVALKRWIADYAQRRYGRTTPQIVFAWQTLLETAYHDPGYSHHGGYTQMFTYRPHLAMHCGAVFNELNSEIIKEPYYDPKVFYTAVEAMMTAYEDFKDVPCFIYDLQDLLRQTLNLLGTNAALRCLDAIRCLDLASFDSQAADFLALLDACDQVMRVRQDTLLANWSGKAAALGHRYDDFTEDLFAMHARALITTWGHREAYTCLSDYAYRQYGGLLSTFYHDRWVMWLSRQHDALACGREPEDPSLLEWFRQAWQFVLNGTPEETAAPIAPDAVFPQAMQLIRQKAGQLGLC